MSRFNGVHHLSMSVPSLAAARAFYVELMGFAEVFDYAWAGSAAMDQLTGLSGSAGKMMFLDAGNLLLEVFEYESPAPQAIRPDGDVRHFGYTHLCLDVDDAAAAYERLKAAGVRFHSAPMVSDHVVTVYGLDPFGNVFELQQIKAESIPSRVLRSAG